MFKEYYKKVLVEAINKAANKEVVKTNSDIVDIMENLSYLRDSEEGPAGKKSWIPLYWKRIFVKAAWGMDIVVRTKLTTFKENVSTSATTTITIKGEEVAYAESYKTFDAIAIFDSTVTSHMRNTLMKQYALGSSERLAYYRLGICMDYTGDIEELEQSQNENQTLNPETASDIENALNKVEKALEEETKKDEVSEDSGQKDTDNIPSTIEGTVSELPTDAFEPVADNEELPFTSNQPLAEDFSIALVGPDNIIGRKLVDLEPKFIACLAANIANKKPNYDTVSEEYYNHVMEIINSDSSGTKQRLYTTYLNK